MTEQEAIEILKINCICSPKATEFIKASNVAIKALKKQIPKTVIDVEDGVLCPECKSYVCTYGKVGRKNYCDNCGQKLDWSDEE